MLTKRTPHQSQTSKPKKTNTFETNDGESRRIQRNNRINRQPQHSEIAHHAANWNVNESSESMAAQSHCQGDANCEYVEHV
jgi:hypothetical protein